jgi:large subunit ribosomal protein L15
MKAKKRRKNTRHRGSHTHSGGFKKRRRGSGHRGGVGKAGSGKRADHKKVMKLPDGKPYFGKSKTLRRIPEAKLKTINLRDIDAKGKNEINLEGYKILSQGSLNSKITIKASAASKAALDKVKKAGGDIVIN